VKLFITGTLLSPNKRIPLFFIKEGLFYHFTFTLTKIAFSRYILTLHPKIYQVLFASFDELANPWPFL